MCEFRCTELMSVPEQIGLQKPNDEDDDVLWFAMRVTYNRELSVKQLLDNANIVNYIPIRHVVKYKNGVKRSIAQPAVRGLLFTKCTRPAIMQFKQKLPQLQFITRRMSNKNVPIIVPDDQMTAFIKATSLDESLIEYLNTDNMDFTKGSKVKIHGGELDGMIGKYMRVSGKRAKRLLIQVENIMSVAVELADIDYIEIIK